jgi:DNA invertase Pin-like site-specific DNA recombinase
MTRALGNHQARAQTAQGSGSSGWSLVTGNDLEHGRHPAVPDREVLAVGYVSERSQVPGYDAELERQAHMIERFCARRGWQLVGLVRDIWTPGRRGTGQPSLMYALEQLRRREAACLVLAEVKRLSPSVADLGDVLDAVELAGARFVSLEPAIDTGTPAGRAAVRALRSVSRWERSRRAEMTSAARAKAASPLAIEPKLKRRIRRMRGAGMTLQAIADELNAERIPTPRGGATWRPSSVQAALGYRRPRPFRPRLEGVEGAPQADGIVARTVVPRPGSDST